MVLNLAKTSEGGALPRKSTAEYTWLSVRVPHRLHDDIARAARKDDRTITAEARRLMEEALRARGQLTEPAEDDIDE